MIDIDKDIFESMTKEELIWFIKDKMPFIFYEANKVERDLYFHRWEKKIEEWKTKELERAAMFKKIDFKKRDALAKEYNNSSDTKEKMKLLEKMGEIDKEYSKYLEFNKKVDKVYKESEKLYEVYEKFHNDIIKGD